MESKSCPPLSLRHVCMQAGFHQTQASHWMRGTRRRSNNDDGLQGHPFGEQTLAKITMAFWAGPGQPDRAEPLGAEGGK